MISAFKRTLSPNNLMILRSKVTNIKNLLKKFCEFPPCSSPLSISPTFYEQLVNMQVFFTPFLYLQFDFVIFWQKNISVKAAWKILTKLSTGVNFTHVLLDFFYAETDPKKYSVVVNIFSSSGICSHKGRCWWNRQQVPGDLKKLELCSKALSFTTNFFRFENPNHIHPLDSS